MTTGKEEENHSNFQTPVDDGEVDVQLDEAVRQAESQQLGVGPEVLARLSHQLVIRR